MKKCLRCKKIKTLTDFHKDNSNKDSLSRTCKVCKKTYNSSRYNRNKTHIYAQSKKWAIENADKLRACHQVKHARYRAKKAGLTEHFTLMEWLALCAKYGNKCLACGATDTLMTPDHVVPLSKGGTNTISNIQTLCHSCNSIKKETITDYRQETEGNK